DNNHAEREIRSLVLTRKISGGTRSPRGSETVSTWASICRTLKKQDKPFAQYLRQMQASFHLGTPPPSVFARN
ncbi:MAG: transposase, partial [Deltaproteobacteria bacterium]|nr:transposase [Deltaproteobacteria bacterium]